MNLKDILQNLRFENNLTQEKLASILNTKQGVISKYENGTNIIYTCLFINSFCGLSSW